MGKVKIYPQVLTSRNEVKLVPTDTSKLFTLKKYYLLGILTINVRKPKEFLHSLKANLINLRVLKLIIKK